MSGGGDDAVDDSLVGDGDVYLCVISDERLYIYVVYMCVWVNAFGE